MIQCRAAHSIVTLSFFPILFGECLLRCVCTSVVKVDRKSIRFVTEICSHGLGDYCSTHSVFFPYQQAGNRRKSMRPTAIRSMNQLLNTPSSLNLGVCLALRLPHLMPLFCTSICDSLPSSSSSSSSLSLSRSARHQKEANVLYREAISPSGSSPRISHHSTHRRAISPPTRLLVESAHLRIQFPWIYQHSL